MHEQSFLHKGQDDFAHEKGYHTVHRWHVYLHDIVYFGIQGVLWRQSVCKENKWLIKVAVLLYFFLPRCGDKI